LKVQLRDAAIVADPINDQVVERIAKRGALALNARGEFARQAAYRCLAQDRGKAGRRYPGLKMRTAAARCVGIDHFVAFTE
jgi:hypothetical protein